MLNLTVKAKTSEARNRRKQPYMHQQDIQKEKTMISMLYFDIDHSYAMKIKQSNYSYGYSFQVL